MPKNKINPNEQTDLEIVLNNFIQIKPYLDLMTEINYPHQKMIITSDL